jgi:hypothetical protein
MARWLLLLVALGLALRLAMVARRLLREGREGRAGRAAFLDAAAALLDDVRIRVEPSGFPRVVGRRGGRDFDLQAVPDALAFRKLPALWLLVTLTGPQPVAGETRLMRRASGLEPFSTFTALPVEIAAPPGFPPEVTIRMTAPGAAPAPAIVAGLAALFEGDEALKEIVLSPRGLRLVRLVEEAPRGGYLLYRDADLGRVPLAAGTARPMLDALAALEKEIAAAAKGCEGRRGAGDERDRAQGPLAAPAPVLDPLDGAAPDPRHG